jgi:hypothetical protein
MEILPTPKHRNTMGVVYYRLGRHREAVACFERDPDEQDPHDLRADLSFLAMSHPRSGESAKARVYLDRAVAAQTATGLSAPSMVARSIHHAEAGRILAGR